VEDDRGQRGSRGSSEQARLPGKEAVGRLRVRRSTKLNDDIVCADLLDLHR
jgi:hypothetical protein